ncbi:MAG: hypothetical protein EG823_05255 [Actinobacteria bacterium]|nr:hypothetical protein [Actinomycetota bacterium]
MRRVLATLLLLPLLAAVGCGGLPEGVIYPHITLDQTVTDDIPVSRTFTFEGQSVTLDVTVDGSLYAGAVTADKSVTRFGDAHENDWIEEYFPAFVEEENQAPFYDALIAALRQVRDARGLDADRYAELMVVFAQSLTYQTDPVDLEPKFPVETFVDGFGDCDDKTLMLAGLLSREGYDVAILMFEPEQHVALGIRSEDIAYLDTGYAYVETTAQGFVGMVPDEFADGVALASEPRVFKIGEGETSYTAGAQVQAILDGRQKAVASAETLATKIAEADTNLNTLQAELTALQDQMKSLKTAKRYDEYNALVPEYNAKVDAFNRAADERNTLVADHNELAALDQTIVQGLGNRPAAYAAVRAAGL